MDRPLCACHQEPMHRNGGGKWRCGVRNNERLRNLYDALTGPEFNYLLLKRRRVKALRRMRERKARGKVSAKG